MTSQFLVLGHPISHSRSPQLHNAGFQELQIDAEFDMKDVAPADLKQFIREDFRANYQGAAVTTPHKETIKEHLDFITEAAEQVGAVNTLFWQKDKLCGTNTDGIGALRALMTIPDHGDRRVLLLGAGGAAKAILYALKKSGYTVVVYNRTASKAETMAKKLGATSVESLDHVNPDGVDIVINATSVGLNSLESPLPKSFWRSTHIGFDIVYSPLYTKFLEDCDNAGGKMITGDKMLVHQAIEQFKIWHNMEVEPEIMEAAFFEN